MIIAASKFQLTDIVIIGIIIIGIIGYGIDVLMSKRKDDWYLGKVAVKPAALPT